MKIHFIGIGGIGVSALAQYYLSENHKVSGSDLSSSETTDFLKEKGIDVKIGEHKKNNLPDNTDKVIYSPAVKKENPELKKAKEVKTKVLSYPEALGELTEKYFTVAVSGTHGKSTITSILGSVLAKTGLDPTVILGTKLKEFGGTNFRKGKSRYLIIEADEWNASFLNYSPNIIVLNNIEEEHLDYYKDLDHIMETFQKFISLLPKEGILVANKDDDNTKRLTEAHIKTSKKSVRKVIYYSKNEFKKLEKIKKHIKIPGNYNALNALAAMHVALELGVEKKAFLKALSRYKGAWRRFEIIRENPTVISDYGHHPTEVLKTTKAAREKYPEEEITLIFQPHQYQRTHYLFFSFKDTFKEISKEDLADEVIITDIFDVAGREEDKTTKKTNSKKLVKETGEEKVRYVKKENLLKELKNKKGVIIVMGAGDIYKICKEL